MTKLIVGFFSLFLFSLSTAQPLWGLEPRDEDFAAVSGDTSIAYLQSLIIKKEDLRHISAGRILAYYYGVTERDFIVSELRMPVPQSPSSDDWWEYMTYQQIRGFLGDSGAIAGMDTVAQFAVGSPQFWAISHLAEAGRLDYFDVIKNIFFAAGGYTQAGAVDVLGYYGQDPHFRSESASLLMSIIRDSTNVLAVWRAAMAMAKFDRPLAAQLVDSRFRSAEDGIRRSFFDDLDYLDRDGQPERSMFATPLEQNDYSRSNYFPLASSVIEGLVSRRYFEPSFIKFALQWLGQESAPVTKVHVSWFLKGFIPLRPASDMAVLGMIDTLGTLTDTMSEYGWVSDQSYITELKNHLQAARMHLTSTDSVACSAEIRAFQHEADDEYGDSLDGDSRFISREAWKFLHYNAQYVLDRLSKTR